MFTNKKISFKIIGLFFIIILAMGVTLSMYSFYRFESNITADKIDLLNEKVINLKTKLHTGMDQVEMISNNINAFVGVQNFFKFNESYEAQKELEIFGEEVSNISEGIFIANKSGEVVLDSENGALLGINISDREYFMKSLEGEMVWSQVIRSKATDNLIVVFSRPYELNNQVRGVVGITVKFNYFTDIVDQVKVGENGYAYMIDSNGIVLAHPDKDKILTENISETEISGLKKQIKAMMNKQSGVGSYTYEGVTKLNAYDYINDYGIAVNVPENEFMSLLENIRNKMMLMTSGILFVALLLTYFVIKKITSRIVKMSEVAETLATGDITVDVMDDSTDEVGQLAKSFKRIIEDIKKQTKVTEEIANGNLEVTINKRSNEDILNGKLIELRDKFKEVIQLTENNTKEILHGNLTARIDDEIYSNEWKTLVSNINEISSSFEQYINTMPLTMAIFNKENGVQYINQHGLEFLGLTLEEARQEKCYNLFNTTDCNTEHCACKIAIEKDRQVSSSTQATVDGETYDVNYDAIPIKDKAGEIIGAFEVVTDQTEIMRNQRLIKKRNAYQKNEVEKLVVNLNQLAQGNLDLETNISSYDEDTKEVAHNFKEINEKLEESTNVIQEYIDDIAVVLEGISNGDLDQEVNKEYRGDFAKIKESLNIILESLNQVISDIAVAADEVATGSREVARSAEDLSQGSTEQASAVEQINSAITSIAEKTRINAENAQEVNTKSNLVIDNAENGTEKMNEMIEAMDLINKSSKNIGKIIKVIDEIAFQTNILALNAAVEAERAGKYGKGFAVVAEEVRNLAGRSAEAAKNTTELIEDSIEKIALGTETAEETSVALIDIVKGIGEVSEIIDDISTASNEQAVAIDEIKEALEQVNDVTQSNTATAEESSAASEEMSSQAEVLNEKVSRFDLRNEVINGEFDEGDNDILEISLEDDFGKY